MNVYDDPKYYDIAFSFRNILEEANFIEECIAKYSRTPVKTFLELASGNSPHIEELSSRGYGYVGLELNSEMIRYAQQKIESLGCPAEIVRADMRQFSLPASVDCALVFLGSLYVANDEELGEHLISVARALRSGGLYILESVVEFYPEDVHTQTWNMERGTTKVSTTYEVTWLNREEKILSGKIILDIDDAGTQKRIEHSEIRKIYSVKTFIERAEQTHQWEYVAACSDFDLDQPPREGARNILVLRRR